MTHLSRVGARASQQELPSARLLFVVNVGWFFVSHRLSLAQSAADAGCDVHVATALDPELDKNTQAQLAASGLALHELRFSRSGAHPAELVRDFFDLIRLYRRVRPDVVHLVTIKPILLGGLAAKLMGIRRVVLAVPGRGSVFSQPGLMASLRRWLAIALYRLAYRRGSNRVIIQNTADRDYFVSRGVFQDRDIRLIRGSGVQLDRFTPREEPGGEPTVVFASRMLREKGVADFVAAARLLRDRGVGARMVLVGDPDHGNPHSHTREELEAWAASGVVEWLGFRADMSAIFSACHVVCLPTYYGEGVPKVLIEAAACGKPIVTTDMPGCRDIVRHDENGLLVPARDVAALAKALETLILDPPRRKAMGRRGRELVQQEFGLDLVVRKTHDLYRELLQ